MPGTERIFIDAQWLKAFDADRHWTLFSRSRATVDYDAKYRTCSPVLISIIRPGAGCGRYLARADIFFRAPGWMEACTSFKANERNCSCMHWSPFSSNPNLPTPGSPFCRYPSCSLNDRWKLYTSLELFSNFQYRRGMLASVQRIQGWVRPGKVGNSG